MASEPKKLITFLEFCKRINVQLTDVQRVLCAVAYDSIEPEWLEGNDREIARQLFGPVEKFPPGMRDVNVHLCGARGGKSYVLCALRLLFLSLTVPLDILAPGEIASALIVAPDKALARQTFRYVVGAATQNPMIHQLLSNITRESLIVNRSHDKKVIIEVIAATKGGSAIRARNYVGACLDEMSFFRNESYQVNDAEIFQAVSPRIMKGGQLICASTAWATSGLMYNLVTDNWGHPKTALACIAPTLLLNPEKAEEVAKERERNPVNAQREFDCEFMTSGTSIFFDHSAIQGALDDTKYMPLTPASYPGSEVVIGADTGFRKDSSAIVVAYRLPTGHYIIADMMEMRPKTGQALKPTDVVRQFATMCERHGCDWLVADGHYRETIEEELSKYKLNFVPADAGVNANSLRHMTVKLLLNSGKLHIPKDTDGHRTRLIDQFKSLIGKPLSGGGMSFSMPRSATGGHGDILSAAILALSQKSGEKVAPAIPKPVLTGKEIIAKKMKEYWAKYEQGMQEKTADANEISAWQGDGDGWGYWDGNQSDDGVEETGESDE